MWETDSETYNGLTVKKRAGTWNGINKEIIVQEGKTYTFSVFIKSDSNRQVALYTSGGTSGILDSVNKNITTNWERYSLTFTANKTGTVKCRVENTTSIEGNYTYICGYQLEENSTATSYVAHQEQNYTITLPTGMELCKIGDYQDYIYGKPNEWYLRKKIKKVILDENYGISIITDRQFNVFIFQILDYLKVGENICLSDFFLSKNNVTGLSIAASTNHTCCFRYGDNVNAFYITNDAFDTVEDFKTWLSNNPVKLYYVLSTSTDTQITDTTLINQLNDIYNKAKTYQGVTHITQTNSDMPFILTLDYKKSNLLRIKALEEVNS